ncbi:helix-turn-helix domain-containing protein [Luteimonas granuli]|uniref:Helix-turn-helix domain-containing protein n=1 Tax=Luteimonas granuli TaxID=1176533 RepID=A0A518N1B6_9GAMM|nr:helix-turn-helix domain-containing protein [Luteimonas granuli]QDW65689.1 helix-turn-helix domain-containing protein [Luteimonas granuli]
MMPPDQNMTDANRGCGQRLRAAREAAGLSLHDVASRLKMPVRVVESLEAEDWDRLGAPVFIRGQLRSYARLLGLATETVHMASGVAPVRPVELTPRTYVPRMRLIAEQSARRLVYVVITAAIALPVWLATRPHLAPQDMVSGSLDVPADIADDAVRQAPRGPTPLVASMAPVAQRQAPAAAAPQQAPAFELRTSGDSWIEITTPEGGILEQTLLRSGAVRAFAPGEVGGVVLGNAGAVEVRRDGVEQDISPYLRANVARFTVSSDGSLAPAGH